MTVNELVLKLNLTPLVLPDGGREITGCYAGDLLSWVMSRAKAGNLWFTIMNHMNVLAVASLADVAAVVLAEGETLGEKELAVAGERGINVLTSGKSVYELCVEAGGLNLRGAARAFGGENP